MGGLCPTKEEKRMGNLRYCYGCGEAMESENAWDVEHDSLFTSRVRIVYWCNNAECPRVCLIAITGFTEKPTKEEIEENGKDS